jgi:general secretion pathway protein K
VARRFPEPPDSERGFVLIAAIWLLVLAGAIVALLMLSTLTFAKRARFEADQLQSDLALQSALQTVAADRLINGVRGPWGLLPAEGDVRLGDNLVHVRLSSEAGRLDLNEADPKLIDAALRGLGAEASARQAFVAAILAIRLKHERIGSFDQIRASARRAGFQLSAGVCLDEVMTFASGLAEPRPGQEPADLAHALGSPVPMTPGADNGDALRFEATDSAGRFLRSTLRIRGGRIPLAISSMDNGSDCGWRVASAGVSVSDSN